MVYESVPNKWGGELPKMYMGKDFWSNYIADFYENQQLDFPQWLEWLKRWEWALANRQVYDGERLDNLEVATQDLSQAVSVEDPTDIELESTYHPFSVLPQWDADLNTTSYKKNGGVQLGANIVYSQKTASKTFPTSNLPYTASNGSYKETDGLMSWNDGTSGEALSEDMPLAVLDKEISDAQQTLEQSISNIDEKYAALTEISPDSGNEITRHANGLYVPDMSTDLTSINASITDLENSLTVVQGMESTLSALGETSQQQQEALTAIGTELATQQGILDKLPTTSELISTITVYSRPAGSPLGYDLNGQSFTVPPVTSDVATVEITYAVEPYLTSQGYQNSPGYYTFQYPRLADGTFYGGTEQSFVSGVGSDNSWGITGSSGGMAFGAFAFIMRGIADGSTSFYCNYMSDAWVQTYDGSTTRTFINTDFNGQIENMTIGVAIAKISYLYNVELGTGE